MTTFFSRISPIKIILNHFGTLYNSANGKLDYIEVFLVGLGPWLLSGFLVYFKDVSIDANLAQILFAAFAITGGFLINSLVVLADKHQQQKSSKANQDHMDLLQETFYNTSFGVLTCVFSVIFCAIYPFVTDATTQNLFIFFIFGLSFLFVHTLLMVIKRLNKVFDL